MTERAEDFVRWVEPHLTVLARYAARRVAPADRDRVVADALVRAWHRWPTYDASRSSPEAWLLGSLADDRGRPARRPPTAVVEVVDEAVAAHSTRDVDLERAVEGLPRGQRRAVDLHHFVGLEVGSVAGVLRCTPEAAATTLRHARVRLCELLGDHGDDVMRERLTAAGRRWQDDQPPPPGVPLARLTGAPERTFPYRVVGIAALGVVLVGVGVGAAALVRSLGEDGSAARAAPVSTSDSTSDSASVPGRPQVDRVTRPPVPWQDLRPGHPVLGRDLNGLLVTPFDDVSATGRISGSFHPGDTLVFDAELMAPGLVPLKPCPDYTISFGTHTVTRQLNCARVPYFASFVHPDGRVTAFRPVLPAGTVVVFRMQVTVPDDPGEQKVLWTLDGPQTTPGFNGTVTVRPGR